MSAWVLSICTYGILGICSQYIEAGYQSEESCYRAMDSLYKVKGESSFLYIYCKPAKKGGAL